jgi:hypothetical protein
MSLTLITNKTKLLMGQSEISSLFKMFIRKTNLACWLLRQSNKQKSSNIEFTKLVINNDIFIIKLPVDVAIQ